MPISVDGQSLILENCTITFNNAFDPSTGVATITITPSGGLSTLPGLVQGDPGPSPVLRNVVLNQVPPGDPLPSPPGQWTLVALGGPGVASVYDLTLSVYSGAQGEQGLATNLTSAPDITDAAPANGFTLAWDAVANLFTYVPQLFNNSFSSGTANSVVGSGQTSLTLTSITIPPQNFSWFPKPHGQVVFSGTDNTIITVTANLNSPTGVELGRGWAVGGKSFVVVITPRFWEVSAAQIPAGVGATVYFVATQTAATSDPWSNMVTQTAFTVDANAILI